MKLTLEIEKAPRGGYIVHQNGGLLAASSTAIELYDMLGEMMRSEFKEAVKTPTRPERQIEVEPIRTRSPYVPPPKVAEPPPAPVEDLIHQTREHLNGMTLNLAGKIPAVGAALIAAMAALPHLWPFGA